MGNIDWEWLSLKWFAPETLKGFDWGNNFNIFGIPVFLILGLLIPLFFVLRWLFKVKGRQKLDVALPESRLKSHPMAWLRFVPPVMLLIAAELMLVALARPQNTNEQVDQWSEGIDIMVVLDISESMQIQDLTPNRLQASKQVAKDFVSGRMQDRIGLVIFSGEAISYAPLTTDFELLNSLIDDIDFGMVGKGGTAIGSALAVAVSRMEEVETTSKVIILLSDGENNAGSIDPVTAANLAYAYGIKVYTIGIGREGRVPFGTDMFGRPRYIEESFDETGLRDIASIGQGEYFRATDNNSLADIFERIDQYEKAEIKETRYKDVKDYYHVYLLYGLMFFFAWMLLKSTFMSNVLED